MIFYASIRRELAQSFTAVLVVLLSIVMTMMLIRTLGLTTRGKVNPQDLFLIMGYLTLSLTPTILTLSLFISFSSCLVRWYQDAEMSVWFSSGQSLFAFLRPALLFAWPILLTIALLSLFVWPWANSQIDDLRVQFAQRSDIDRIAPGEFQSNSSGSRVFFIEKGADAADGSLVFIYGKKAQRETITVAQGGRVERLPDGSAELQLNQGQSVNHNSADGRQNISAFERYNSIVLSPPDIERKLRPIKSTPSHHLAATAEGRGELSWRLGIVLSAINFLLLTLLLIKNTQRSGKGSHYLLIIMSFAVYYNLITFGKNWVANGKIGFGWWLLLLHGGVFAASLIALLYKQGSWRGWFATRRAAAQGQA